LSWFGSSFAKDLDIVWGTKAAMQKKIMMKDCKDPKMLLSVSKNLSFANFVDGVEFSAGWILNLLNLCVDLQNSQTSKSL